MADQEFGHGAKHIAPAHTKHQPAAAPDLLAAAAARHAGPSAAGQGAGTARTADAAPPAEVSTAELHPSWAAKSAAKAQLAAKPAGTKVVFSDDGDPVAAAEPAANGARHQLLPPPPTVRPNVGSAARAAAKAAVPAANGQQPRVPSQPAGRVPGVLRHRDRAVADVAPGISSAKRPPARLHPSWEAKAKLRRQMEHLPAPAGTKVVFDDSE